MTTRCRHCRNPLEITEQKCGSCDATLAEEVPDSKFTLEVRLVHNPSGTMLFHRHNFPGYSVSADGWASMTTGDMESFVDGIPRMIKDRWTLGLIEAQERERKVHIKYVPNHIVEKCQALGVPHSRELENGDLELYDGKTGEVIRTIPKSEIDGSTEHT